MGEAESISWRTFFDLYEKAEKKIREKIDDFCTETGAAISVVIKRFTEKVESDNYIEQKHGRLVMEVTITEDKSEVAIAEDESEEKKLMSLIGRDLPLKGSNPKEIAEKFASIFGEATKIIKEESRI